jgi:hypothetical protein
MIRDSHLRCSHSRKRKRASTALSYIHKQLARGSFTIQSVAATPFRPLPLSPSQTRPPPTLHTPSQNIPFHYLHNLAPQQITPRKHIATPPVPNAHPFHPPNLPPSLSQRLPSLTASQPAIASWFVWRWGLAEEKGERRWIVYGVDI